MKGILVDTGPLVAVLSRRDRWHETCVGTLASLQGPVYSCWPVITEVAWLLRKEAGATQILLKRISEGAIKILAFADSEADLLSQIMDKYRSLNPQLADVMLVYLAARESINTIFTLDRRDFSIYRLARGRPLNIIPEAS